MGTRKVVLVATEFSTGGVGSYLATLAPGLCARGWEVQLVATDRPGDLFAALAGASARHDLSALPLSAYKVRHTARLLGQIAPQVILLNHAALAHYALPLLGVAARPLAVIHSEDARYYRTAALFQRRICGWIAPSRRLAERFAPGLPPARRSRVRVIPHGVDPSFRVGPEVRSRQRGEGGKDPREVRIIFVGFLGRTKGADLLPAIMRQVCRACPSASLTLVGEGPLRAELEASLAAGATPGRWRFAGSVARAEVARLLRESDILLLPTRLEGFGLAIPEAMLCGCVPVVSRLAGVTDEIVDSGRSGLLVEPGDAPGFADAVLRLAQDRALRESCAAAAREVAELKFSVERMLDAYEALFAGEDDRGQLRRHAWPGWAAETAREVLRGGIKARWLGRRLREIVGYPG